MPINLKEKFDNHQIVIVPHETLTEEKQEWKVLVLDKGIWKKRFGTMTFSELREKKLAFQTPSRPRAHHGPSMSCYGEYRHSEGETPDDTMAELTKAWGTRSGYLCDNVIRGFVEELGNEIPEDAKEEMLNHSSEEGIEADELANTLEDLDVDNEDEGGSDIDN
ncbi:hypothetical protein AJ79_05714 [Helicocarpus griseus UAMH5409]|uniref:Uncharacterized protein n=1 Tax=Helicocarpus griseus UAMH5409 TaxID=1447875 RepID=A0A2B7XJS5_9EURO|nr:hypothetical protein AJ79_05714 [Helicocarpus griseus UAMH5409]